MGERGCGFGLDWPGGFAGYRPVWLMSPGGVQRRSMRQPKLDSNDPSSRLEHRNQRSTVGQESTGPGTEAVSAQRVQCGAMQS